MTYSSRSQKQQTIRQRIDNVLDFKPSIKIRKLEQGMIKVNDMLIHCEDIGWHVEGEHFFRRKSAVGYALCLIKEQHSIAKRIKQLDNELQKVCLLYTSPSPRDAS